MASRISRPSQLSRRRILQAVPLAAIAVSPLSRMFTAIAAAAPGRPPRILLRSSWQTVNIGDIAHTPGVIRLLGEHLPEAEITLWPSSIADGVEEMLRRNFPKLKFAQKPEEVTQALADCDFLLHGSGPSIVGLKQLIKWRKETSKPYGIYGVTLATATAEVKEVVNNAQFIYFRDSISLKFAKDHGLMCPIMEFGPDGAFAVNLRNDEAATAFLRANGLEDGKFLCCIPRLRFTQYWKLRKKEFTAEDQRRETRDEEMKEHDHAPLREAIAAVTKLGMKVLLCPEDASQMAIGKEMLFDKLPAEVKTNVVWHEKYWLTDEALSTYVRSAGLFGLEMHSPIMCIGNGIPAIVCRFKEQTSKGIMWRDIGLGDWLFDMDEPDEVSKIVPTVLSLIQDPAGTKAKVAKAQEFVKQRQRETMAVVAKSIPKT